MLKHDCLKLTVPLQALWFGDMPSAFTRSGYKEHFYETCHGICCPDVLGDIIHFSFLGHLDGVSWEKHLSEARLEKSVCFPEH